MTVRLRLTCADAVREVAFDRRSISIGRGPFNDVVFADADLARVHGELEVGDDASLTFHARASGRPTRVLRDGECTMVVAGDEEQRLHLHPDDVVRMGEEPGVDMEIVNVEIGQGASWSTLALPENPDQQLSAQSARLLYILSQQLANQPDSETFLRCTALFVGAVVRRAPCEVELAIPIETQPWRSDDHMLQEVTVDLSEACGELGIGAVEARFMRTRDPLPPFGSAATAILRELESLDRCVITPAEDGVVSLLVPISLEGELAAVLDLSFRAALDDPLLEQAAGAAALMQPLALVVLGRDRQERHCESLREENRYWRQRERRHYLFKDLIAESEPMRAVYEELNVCVPDKKPVLIAGEAGCGKALLARALHHLGPRKDGMLISINCRDLFGEQLDFELFGSVANDLSGDVEPRKGIFELADGGTVFLEEIDRLSAMLQGKLLRMLREGEVRRIGDAISRRVDVRLVASTHQDLSSHVGRGRFRRDLYLALRDQVLEVPPLRDRRADIMPLARTFLATFAERYGQPCRRLAPEVRDKLVGHRWQGNVRELKAVVEAAVLNCDDEVVEVDDLGL
ncbi:MAG: sigma 54-interacting transcriptional regulator [Persicimonas sp.]